MPSGNHTRTRAWISSSRVRSLRRRSASGSKYASSSRESGTGIENQSSGRAARSVTALATATSFDVTVEHLSAADQMVRDG